MRAVAGDLGNGAADTAPAPPARRKRAAATPATKPRRPRTRRAPAVSEGGAALHSLGWLAGEGVALAAAGVIAALGALGRFAAWFTDAGLWAHLVPFAAAVLGLGGLTALGLWGWWVARARMLRQAAWLPATVALCLAAGATVLAMRQAFRDDLANLRALVSGPAAAERIAIAHQVYATYRRADPAEWRRVLERARAYELAVHEAAVAFDLDAEVLMGVAAAESSFVPRTSKDGGRGLFQLTQVPAPAVAAAQGALGVKRLDVRDHRHNAFAGAATLRRYLDDVGGDLFLGLLAYNMGPRNGGLRSIMDQYGARDFVTIQPYLQLLPRDYPIRVLAAALAYRLWRTDGRLPRYEEGDNARLIQAVGIPGFPSEPLPSLRSARPSS